MSRGAAGLLLLAGACAPRALEPPPATPALAPPALHPAVDEALARLADHGLPPAGEDEVAETGELLDLWLIGGAAGARAARALEQMDEARLAARLLAIAEQLDAPDGLRRAATAWLAARAPRSALPRLTLRLKYETDWSANVDLALGLLRLGSGAGLEALTAILGEEASSAPSVLEARSLAAAALRALPPRAGWEPGAAFAADWERLQEVRAVWDRERRLPAAADGGDDPDLEAELWRAAALLRSQPLRPVDDARYVLARAPAAAAFPVLLEAAHDADRYVRDHALETISWVGGAFGRWATEACPLAAERLGALAGDASTRPRALEALGSLGEARAAAWLLPWLAGNAEEATAAADALLRCAGPDALRALAGARPVTPEARYSLALLRRLHDDSLPAPEPAGLDPAEAERRSRWFAERD